MSDHIFTNQLFGRLKAIGTSIENVAVNVGGTVASAGTKVVGVVKDIPNQITYNSDFEHIRSINELARQKPVRKDHQYTEQEWEDADKRADTVLDKLYSGYFEDNFDPVKYELEQLTSDAGQEEIDSVVEKLTFGVEKATGKLSRRVFTKRDQLLNGMSTVASVGDDLKAAFMIVRTSRASLKQSSEEIMRNVRVAGQTRRKQYYMELLQICANIKRARDFQQKLKRAQEMGEYGEAILLCVECFQDVEGLRDLKVSEELRSSVQRSYVETVQRLDSALTAICGEYEPTRYSKVLEGYMLQGIQGHHLAEKVIQCFKEAIMDSTMKVVRSLILTKPKILEQLAFGGSLEGTYAQLCQSLPVDLLRPCLQRQMEVVFDILASYYVMEWWHQHCLQKHEADKNAQTEGNEEAQQEQTIAAFLAPVCEALSTSRREVFQVAALRVRELFIIPGLFKSEDYLQVVEWGQKFMGVGEAFLSSEAADLRSSLLDTTIRFFDTYHHSNMESLNTLLQSEQWKHASKSTPVESVDLQNAIVRSPLCITRAHEDGSMSSFEQWVMQGNPFTKASNKTDAVKKHWKQAMMDVMHHVHPDHSSNPLSLRGSAMTREWSQFSMNSEDSETSTPASWIGSVTGSSMAGGLHPSANLRQEIEDAHHKSPLGPGLFSAGSSVEVSGPSTSSVVATRNGPSDQGHGTSTSGPIITVSSGQALKCLKAYGQLFRALPSSSLKVFSAMCDVFDCYFLNTFILFSGVSLETLVLQDNIVPNRLKTSLMRILSQPNSKYRYAVEELKKMKAQQSSLSISSTVTSVGAAPASLLDRFASKMESIATDVERSMSHMQQKLNDKVQTIQMPAAISSIAGEVAAAVQRVEMLSGNSVTSGQLHGLNERIVATESLQHMADVIQAGRSAILALMPPGAPQVQAEHYFSPRGTLEAAKDLRDTLFRGAARKLLAGLLDQDRGISNLIASTNYNLREPIMVHSPWADKTVQYYSQFRDLIAPSKLPASAMQQVWDHALLAGSEAIVEGLSKIKKCTFEGRASMSYDLGHVERSVRALAPPGLSVTFRSADSYIKAFYLPWEELTRWCQVHLVEIGKWRVIALVELVSDAYGVKRAQRAELLGQIEIFARE